MSSSLSQQQVLHHVLPHGVVEVQVDADDQTGDQHDRGSADDSLLARPLDLLELRPGLPDEMDRPRAGDVALVRARLPARGLRVAARAAVRGRPGGATRRRAPCEGRLLLRAPVAALLTRLPRHARSGLPSLPMRGVRLAPAAVLLELDPVGRVPLRFVRLIVPPLALRAGERDCDSDSSGHFFCLYLEVDALK